MSQARLGCGSAVCIGLNSIADLFGDWDGAKPACVRIALNAHRRDRARGKPKLLAVLGLGKLKFQGDRAGPEPAHPHADIDSVLETQRVPVFALGLDTRPAEPK